MSKATTATPTTMNVYRVNDCDWYMATSLEEAIQTAMRDTGLPRDEATDEPYQLSVKQLWDLPFIESDGKTIPFATKLLLEIERDPVTPRMFATTEY